MDLPVNISNAEPCLKTIFENMPKTELHAHLNGSLSKTTVEKLIAQKGKKNPSSDYPLGINFTYPSKSSLSECFKAFQIIHDITDTPEAIKLCAFDVIKDFYLDGVKHLEIRSTPREVFGSMSYSLYVQSILSSIEECKSSMPDISVKLILSVDRRNPVSVAQEVLKVAEENLLSNSHVVGIDLSGNPLEGKVSCLMSVLERAKKLGLKLSIHMAEVPGTDEEVTELLSIKPDRIGHGTYLHPSKGGSELNYSTLQQLQVPLELCLTSNVVSKTVPSYSEHHFPLWRQLNYPCVLCTDDKGVFNTSLSNEYYLAHKYYSLSVEDLWDLSYNSIDSCFIDVDLKKQLQACFLNEKKQFFAMEHTERKMTSEKPVTDFQSLSFVDENS